jgi:hypothetical protein
MKIINSNTARLLLRIYTITVLIVLAVLASPSLSFIPIVLLLWYLFQWRCQISFFVGFMTQYFMFFALGLLFTIPLGPYFAVLISLPLLLAVNQSLIDVGRSIRPHASRYRRSLTQFGVIVISVFLAVFLFALIIPSLTLMLACGILVVFFGAAGIFIRTKLPSHPVGGEQVQSRVIAGREGQIDIILLNNTKLWGMLFLESPYNWFKISPQNFIPLKGSYLSLKVSATPALSGPEVVKIKGYIVDFWGLSQIQFEIEPVKLVVIPRARYAEWLARKYLSGIKPGILPLISNIGSIKPLYGLRRGVEYYGSRMYQPGDSLKNIDWKHSVKYNELVSKEFSEVQTQPAILLINLVAGNAEELDKLVYNILVTAMSLAHDNIPAAMAVYNDEEVVLITQSLTSQNLVASAVQIAQNAVKKPSLRTYMKLPDVIRLRSNINRLAQFENQPTVKLRELLRIEYKSLSNNALTSPCTGALNGALASADRQSTIISISQRNHDAEALAFMIDSLTQKGNPVVTI